MDLDPTHRERIKAEIKRIFAWLRAPSRTRDKNKGDPTLGLARGRLPEFDSFIPTRRQDSGTFRTERCVLNTFLMTK
jgi:hypothetical protein